MRERVVTGCRDCPMCGTEPGYYGESEPRCNVTLESLWFVGMTDYGTVERECPLLTEPLLLKLDEGVHA